MCELEQLLQGLEAKGYLACSGSFKCKYAWGYFCRALHVSTEADLIALTDDDVRSYPGLDGATTIWVVWFKDTLKRVADGVRSSHACPPDLVRIHCYLKGVRDAAERARVATDASSVHALHALFDGFEARGLLYGLDLTRRTLFIATFGLNGARDLGKLSDDQINGFFGADKLSAEMVRQMRNACPSTGGQSTAAQTANVHRLQTANQELAGELRLCHENAKKSARELEQLKSVVGRERQRRQALEVELDGHRRRFSQDLRELEAASFSRRTRISELEADIAALQAEVEVGRKRKRDADAEGRRDADEVLEDLNSRSLAGRSLAWLRDKRAKAGMFVDRLTAVEEVLRAAVPVSFLCPITQAVMVDPVMLVETGMTYERGSIQQWLARRRTDPSTNVRLTDTTLQANHGLRMTIQEFTENNA
jgi:hypothetical protein